VIDTVALREKVLDLAIRGKLVPQDPNDEPASVLLERIRAQKQQMVKDGKLKPKDIKDDSIIFVGEDNLHYEKFADGTVKCIDDEIPFELPEGWAWSKINNIAFVTKLAGFEYSKYIAPTLCEEGIPLFKGKNVQDSKIIYEFESFIPESISDELSMPSICASGLFANRHNDTPPVPMPTSKTVFAVLGANAASHTASDVGL
jgi:type I restriction enzyme S subunit